MTNRKPKLKRSPLRKYKKSYWLVTVCAGCVAIGYYGYTIQVKTQAITAKKEFVLNDLSKVEPAVIEAQQGGRGYCGVGGATVEWHFSCPNLRLYKYM